MKNYIRFVSCSLISCLIMLLSGCGGNTNESDETPSSSKNKPNKDYDIFIYNNDMDISEKFEKMCSEYSSRMGVTVKCFTEDPDEDNTNTLGNYMKSGTPPSIFTIDDLSDLKKWQDSGNVLDFSNAMETKFKDIANNIPESLRLSSNTKDSFGIPYTVKGYGYLVDPKMLSSLFGADKYRAVLNDLKDCQYDEFEGLVNALNSYITSGQVYEIRLNGKPYSFVDTKGGMAENLTGVFSFTAGDAKQTGAYMVNAALGATFDSAANANVADDSQIDSIKSPMMRVAKSLDLVTSNVAGKDGQVMRGIELVDTTSNGYNQSIKNFVSGRSLFLLDSNSCYSTLVGLNSTLAKRVVFIPIKMPIATQDITSSITQKRYNTSIPVYVPRYYAINAKVSEREQKLSQDFLVWLETSELAEKHVIQEFGYVPYYTKESTAIDNPISRSMIEYMSMEHILPGVCNGAPERWCNDTVAKYIIDQYYTKSIWTELDYNDIAEYAIRKWKELKTN